MNPTYSDRATAERIHAIAEDICRHVYGDDQRNWPNGLCNYADMRIAGALAAEREAAAKVADDHRKMHARGGPRDDVALCFKSAEIRDAIRARSNPNEGK